MLRNAKEHYRSKMNRYLGLFTKMVLLPLPPLLPLLPLLPYFPYYSLHEARAFQASSCLKIRKDSLLGRAKNVGYPLWMAPLTIFQSLVSLQTCITELYLTVLTFWSFIASSWNVLSISCPTSKYPF